MQKIIFFYFSILIFSSCNDNTFRFEEPQPQEQPNLNTIPKKLRGTYQSESDSSYLLINKQHMIKWVKYDFVGHKDSLDIEIDSAHIVQQTDQSILLSDGNFNLQLTTKRDSASGFIQLIDTLFSISNRNLLRKYKGHFFLNYQHRANYWKVKKLTLSRKNLSISTLFIPENIQSLTEITEIKEISNSEGKVRGYKLNPTKKELKKLMRLVFTETGSYKKISKRVITPSLLNQSND